MTREHQKELADMAHRLRDIAMGEPEKHRLFYFTLAAQMQTGIGRLTFPTLPPLLAPVAHMPT